MPRHFVYKVMYDSGGAPCVQDDLLSLAICKPQIRRTAQRGDWIYGFGGNNDSPPNRLIYIAQVADRLSDGGYYELSEYADRPDAIYQRDLVGDLVPKHDARFHTDVTDHVRAKDIGTAPHWSNANVLVADHFRYFGHRSDDRWKSAHPHLAKALQNLGQGHLVRHTPEVLQDLETLQKQTFKRYRKPVLGHSTESNNKVAGRCNKPSA